MIRTSVRSATIGIGVWLAVAALGHFGYGITDLVAVLFLFAPLVVVPLSFAAIGPESGGRPMRVAVLLQPLAAGLALLSFLSGSGFTAAALAAPWGIVTGLVALGGLLRIVHGTTLSFGEMIVSAGMLLLPVGGANLLLSRYGATPFGFTEPIVLLTAVHFHYTAFAAVVIVGRSATLFVTAPPVARLLYRASAVGLVSGSPILAAGFVFSPLLQLVAVLLLSGSLGLFAAILLVRLGAVPDARRRALLGLASLCVLVGMGLAVFYAVGEYHGEVWIDIPTMARTHGILNGLGFVPCGLLAWLPSHRKGVE